ncbi:sensor histidine kinase [Streptomyces sp. NRRL F-5123]|uniref:sensor histidine kinase n=1 Tax=Streptomyces sp. NRRL F-5123 TaxID=1463856 RepID=UPI0005B9855C|nr:sensor histidine kinase [Streptomyces sp. NRRL F-5123]
MRPKDTTRVGEFAASPRAPAVVAALLAAAAVTEAAVRVAVAGGGGSPAFALLVVALLALATTVPPVFLSAPPAAVAGVTAAVLSLAAFGTFTAAGAVAVPLTLHRLAAGAPAGGGARVALAVGLAVPFPVAALCDPRLAGEARVLALLAASAAPAAAWAGAARAARAEARVHSAARQVSARSLLEHTARGERARIARELHDVVAHHISMIAVQAETARLTTPGMPPAGAQRLSDIGDTARAGLTEMRRLLGVLRQDAEVDAAERRPQPGLQQLTELVDEARSASGAGVRLIVSGPAAALDPGVELAAFRIVQEALTNVRRHARGAAVDVELHYAHDALRLRVRDNGPGPGAAPAAAGVSGGHGLPGMRERAAAAGGTLSCGRAPGGGFVVEATLPAGAEVLR